MHSSGKIFVARFCKNSLNWLNLNPETTKYMHAFLPGTVEGHFSTVKELYFRESEEKKIIERFKVFTIYSQAVVIIAWRT